AIEQGSATIDQLGGEELPTLASFDGSHTYADNGTYTVTLTAMDDDGGVASGTFMVTVTNVAPTLVATGNQSIAEGALLEIANLGAISDPGFDNPDRPGGPSFETFTYTINWGDGTADELGSATIDQVGSGGIPTLASFDGSHIYADDGVYTVTVTVMDDDGGVATETFEVAVTNDAPTLSLAPNQAVDEGELLQVTNLGMISDPRFHHPNRPGGPSAETFTYTINWGDGTAIVGGDAQIVQSGADFVPTLASF